MLSEDEGRHTIISVVSSSHELPYYWTPRPSLSVELQGNVEFAIAPIEETVRNDVFDSSLKLSTFTRVAAGCGEFCYKDHRSVFSMRSLLGEDALVVSYHGAVVHCLDWVFDPAGTAEAAVFAELASSNIERALDDYISISASGLRREPPLDAIKVFLDHHNYLIRWKALNVLWQLGVDDQLVSARVRSDPHPEIYEQAPFFAGNG